ncbi:MAG TPA: hypothetical protein VN661_00655 [Candidatus Acidoferrales bacterium]|nr:hypothetical protein [Candidatus Acidoferrales bacterium]
MKLGAGDAFVGWIAPTIVLGLASQQSFAAGLAEIFVGGEI